MHFFSVFYFAPSSSFLPIPAFCATMMLNLRVENERFCCVLRVRPKSGDKICSGEFWERLDSEKGLRLDESKRKKETSIQKPNPIDMWWNMIYRVRMQPIRAVGFGQAVTSSSTVIIVFDFVKNCYYFLLKLLPFLDSVMIFVKPFCRISNDLRFWLCVLDFFMCVFAFQYVCSLRFKCWPCISVVFGLPLTSCCVSIALVCKATFFLLYLYGSVWFLKPLW